MFSKIIKKFIKRYKCRAGYGEFLNIAIPLIISTGLTSVQQFINRMFLSWHSQVELAASLPAGLLNFTIMGLFIGTISYVDVFVAQYYGKEDYSKIGPAVWQAVYMSFIGAFILFILSFFSGPIFTLIGHDPEIMKYEIIYFQFLCYGAFPVIASTAFAGFYAGQGKTKVIVLVNLAAIVFNVIFDYIFIFGKFGFASMGIKGAGIATLISSFIMLFIYVLLILRKNNAMLFNTKIFNLDFEFMNRLFKYGFANGVQLFFDIFGWTFFIFMIGKIGITALTATTILININMLVFMPLIGLGITTAIMVGQNLGRNNVFLAERSVYSGFHIALLHSCLVILTYVFFMDYLVYFFVEGYTGTVIAELKPVINNLLVFLIIYAFCDPVCFIVSFAIKGAGDTAFVMKTLILSALGIVVIPLYLLNSVFNIHNVYLYWSIMLSYSVTITVIFVLRYYGGKWKDMRVIEMNQ
ncbi:MATE family efflux transporter [Elusimicrobiota bacterium]